MSLNEELGVRISAKVNRRARPNECVKFSLHVEEIEKVSEVQAVSHSNLPKKNRKSKRKTNSRITTCVAEYMFSLLIYYFFRRWFQTHAKLFRCFLGATTYFDKYLLKNNNYKHFFVPDHLSAPGPVRPAGPHGELAPGAGGEGEEGACADGGRRHGREGEWRKYILTF